MITQSSGHLLPLSVLMTVLSSILTHNTALLDRGSRSRAVLCVSIDDNTVIRTDRGSRSRAVLCVSIDDNTVIRTDRGSRSRAVL